MRHGFIKVAAVTPDIKVADCFFNGESIIREMKFCVERGVKIAVFPELVITGYTCGELFLQDRLLNAAIITLNKIIQAGKDMDMLVFVGLPFELDGKLYNVAAAFKDGELLGLIPKKHIPEFSDLYELRYFTAAPKKNQIIKWEYNISGVTNFGNKLIFTSKEMKNLRVAAEICEDLWVIIPPSNYHAQAGATIIANLSASPETTGKHDYRKALVNGQSARLNAGYIYATNGEGESTTDLVFGGHNLICENGTVLAEKKRFENGFITAEINVDRLVYERRRMNTYAISGKEEYEYIQFSFNSPYITETNEYGETEQRLVKIPLERKFSKTPFVAEDKKKRDEHSKEIITLQALGLKKRILHTGVKHAVIGISGGLDSTLAVMVVCKAFDMLGFDRENIISVTMPCFGTSDRTHRNAIELARVLGITLREINIRDSVIRHLRDIGHDENIHNITFENAQARERTQVLMDLANECNGLVIGTGDMSELALGFTTYNGDQMSMYGVNSSVPKTLIRYLVQFCSEECRLKGKNSLADVLVNILNTPVSPELLPLNEAGEIIQKTEDLIGPYELSDFFLYHIVRWGVEPDKLFRLACETFIGDYTEEEILKWQKSFYNRFFGQQYKRSCMPDGPKVGSISLSPRGDFRMPSDATGNLWR
nr:NAD(+) synthase [uncultured Catonella sp.]